MSIDRHLGMPNTLLQVIQACTLHPAKVKYVNDPTGSGRVQAECQSVFGDAKSNWLQIGGNHVGNDDSSKHHSGHWNPAQPGGYGYVYYPGGNLLKPVFMAGNVTMSQAGTAG